MSDNKKYYYLKLKENFFDSDEMIILESMPDGVVYSNILLKLYLRSLKNEGRLMFNERIPFNSTMLSQVTRQSVGDVEKAVQLFKELGLIEIMDNGAIYMTEIQNFIGRSSTEADRKREFRARIDSEKLGISCNGQMSGQMSDKNPPEIEIEKEKELDIEKEIENKKKPTSKKPIPRHKYGEYNNVLLTDEQLTKLKQEFPDDWEQRIDNVSGYCESTGKSYKNYYATIKSWAKKDNEKRQKPKMANAKTSEYDNLF